MTGWRTEADPEFEGSSPGGPSPSRWREWVEVTADLAEDWAALLLKGFGPAAEKQRLLVRQELARFARFLAQRELERRGCAERSAQAFLAALPAPPADDHPPAVNPGWNSAGAAASAGESPAPPDSRAPRTGDLRRRPRDFEVTEAMFEQFSRVTGLHSAAFSGTPEHVAGLVLYVRIFSLLTCEGDPSDLEMQRLLKKLRLCREQWVAHVAGLFGDGPLQRAGVRPETRLGADPTTRWLLPAPGERGP